MGRKLIGYDGLRERGITLSRVQLWRNMKAGTFPKAIMVGASTRAWAEDEIDAWIEAKLAARKHEDAAA